MNNFERAEVILHLKVAGHFLTNYDDKETALENIKDALSILSRLE
jgi:hypothetical protein